MALFKIFKGNTTAKLVDSSNANYITPVDGYAYYDTSTKLFYIDAAYDPAHPTVISRQPINADKANNENLQLKFNSGSTEGTNLYTYDGKTTKTINIVPGDDIDFTITNGQIEISAGIEVIHL